MAAYFNLNNRSHSPNIVKTLRGLSKATHLMKGCTVLIPTPFVMSSSHMSSTFEPDAMYYKRLKSKFSAKFTKTNSVCFYIIANSHLSDGKFSSHALIGYWNGPSSTLTFIDPNGDLKSPGSNSVYNSSGFSKSKKTFHNVLYNSLISHFRRRKHIVNISVYIGDILPCPFQHSCAYRSLGVIFALISSDCNTPRAIKKATAMLKEKSDLLAQIVRNAFYGTSDTIARDIAALIATKNTDIFSRIAVK